MSSLVYARQSLTNEEKLAKGWIVSNISYGADDSLVIVDVQALINAPAKRVWKLFSDVSRWSVWMPIMSRGWIVGSATLGKIHELPEKVKDVYDIVSAGKPASVKVEDIGKTSINTFEEFDLPWPINNDWVLRRYLFDSTDGSSGKYKVTWRQIFKDKEGCGGWWEISPNNGNAVETLFKYHYVVKRKDGVPKKLFEIIVDKTVDRFIGAIRRQVEEDRVL
jgi:hypothetical protein